jgi:hypothetical protein
MSHAPVGSRTSAFGGGCRGTLLSGEHAPVGNRSSHSYRGFDSDSTYVSYCPSTGVSTVYQAYAPQHAPVGTGECSSLNGRVYIRPGSSSSSQFISAPASFEHADQTREEADKQYREGFAQVGEGVDKIVGDHHPWEGGKSIWGGLQDLDASVGKYHDASREMMEAARDQVQENRRGSPDSMNTESHVGSGGGVCVIC